MEEKFRAATIGRLRKVKIPITGNALANETATGLFSYLHQPPICNTVRVEFVDNGVIVFIGPMKLVYTSWQQAYLAISEYRRDYKAFEKRYGGKE